MSTYRLDKLFSPHSIAVVGASPRAGSLGGTFLRNLIASGFEGALYPVNPRHRSVEGKPCFESLGKLPEIPDLIVVVVPPRNVQGVIEEAGAVGVAAAIIATAGLGHGEGSLSAEVRRSARRHGLRIVGPNCLGVLAPRAKLNASFAAREARLGDLALVSQSGAVAAGLVEWAAQRQVGFSAIVSLGDKLDVDFSDCLDFFSADPGTRAILLYMESIDNAQKFMSAARAAARTKPVVVIKAGRHAQGARAAATHTGALAGSDAVYDAAFRRAGLLRVLDLDQLFAAAETLGRQKPFPESAWPFSPMAAVSACWPSIGLSISAAHLRGVVGCHNGTAECELAVELVASQSRRHYRRRGCVALRVALDALLSDDENDAILILNVPTAVASASRCSDAGR